MMGIHPNLRILYLSEFILSLEEFGINIENSDIYIIGNIDDIHCDIQYGKNLG